MLRRSEKAFACVRNGRGMRQNSLPRLVLDREKQGTKVSSLKWLRKRTEFRGIPRLVLEKAEEKGKIPRLVLDLWKILPEVSNSSSPEDPSRTSAEHGWLTARGTQ